LRGREPRLYNPQETERMRELGGVELARFTSLGQNNQHVNIELNFFENWYSIVYLVLFFGLSFYLRNGRTIGKRIMSIRVVSIVHHRMGLWQSIERALGYGASALEFGFGFVQYFIHPNRRTVHDRMAETIVIRDKPR
jgi:uncharacterized RDD family membrane protein YckC